MVPRLKIFLIFPRLAIARARVEFQHHFDIECPASARLIFFPRMEYQRSRDVLWRRPG
jgi:hypothetical protein